MRWIRGLRSFTLSLLILSSVALWGEEISNIYRHLVVGDSKRASIEAAASTLKNPDTFEYWEAYLYALAQEGEDRKMAAVYQMAAAKWPEIYQNHNLLEAMAWGIIERAARSPSPTLRFYSALGAYFAQDAKGVLLLRQHLRDSSTQVRGIAVQLSSQLKDAPLQQEMMRLLKEESHGLLRLEVIRALGKMQVQEAKESLTQLLAKPAVNEEERVILHEALVALLEKIDSEKLASLLSSAKADYRVFGCELFLQRGSREQLQLITPLLKDCSPKVRLAALQLMGIFQPYLGEQVAEQLSPLLSDPNPYVAMVTAWLLILCEDKQGEDFLLAQLRHPKRELRLFCSGLYSRLDERAKIPLAEIQDRSDDLIVRANIALAMINRRCCLEEAKEALVQLLEEHSERLMWESKGVFRYLAPSRVESAPWMQSAAEVADQMVRLELLSLLAAVGEPKVEELSRTYLRKPGWGITSMAAMLLLSEGQEGQPDFLEPLLSDDERSVRLQAALILSLFGGGQGSVQLLEGEYRHATRQEREQILEALGHIGDRSALPFLIEKFNEPYPLLRLIAASSVLRCLYH